MSTKPKREWLHLCNECGGWTSRDRRVCLGCERSAALAGAIARAIKEGNRQARGSWPKKEKKK